VGCQTWCFFRARLREFKSTATRRRFQLAVSFGNVPKRIHRPERSYLLEVRRKVREEDCLTRAGVLEMELSDLATSSPLPEEPENERVEQWVLDAFRRRWRV
jgi:hypothetical protein